MLRKMENLETCNEQKNNVLGNVSKPVTPKSNKLCLIVIVIVCDLSFFLLNQIYGSSFWIITFATSPKREDISDSIANSVGAAQN